MGVRHYERPDAEVLVEAYRSTCPDAKRSGSEWKGPCPVCEGNDRFWINTRTGALGCRGCCPGRKNPEAYREIMEALGLSETRAALRAERDIRPRRKDTDDWIDRRRIAWATELWGRGHIPERTPAETYLLHVRGAWTRANRPLPRSVRWLPTSAMAGLARSVPQEAAGCLICAYTDTGGNVCAVQFEALTHDGERTHKRWRRTQGVKRGALFRIDNTTSNVVHVAEGEVSAIAIAGRKHGWSAVATGGTAGMAELPQWALPAGTVHVMLHADGDAQGDEAALKACKRLLDAGVAVGFARYADGKDAADGLPVQWYWPEGAKMDDAATEPETGESGAGV